MIFVVSDDWSWQTKAVTSLRRAGIAADYVAITTKSVKAQLRYARKNKAARIITNTQELGEELEKA